MVFTIQVLKSSVDWKVLVTSSKVSWSWSQNFIVFADSPDYIRHNGRQRAVNHTVPFLNIVLVCPTRQWIKAMDSAQSLKTIRLLIWQKFTTVNNKHNNQPLSPRQLTMMIPITRMQTANNTQQNNFTNNLIISILRSASKIIVSTSDYFSTFSNLFLFWQISSKWRMIQM